MVKYIRLKNKGVYMKEVVLEKNICSPETMISLGEKLGILLEENMVITLEGDLGAGKTTLTKGIARGLRINDVVNSPTFTIMKIYNGRLPLYHLDVYRLNNDSGDEYLEEYFYMGGVSVIEWADNVSDIIPEDRISINILNIDEGVRKVIAKANSEKYIKIIESVFKDE